MNTTSARITKLIICAKNDPHLRTIGPIDKVASCHPPPGIKGVIIGIIMSLTSEFTRDVEAAAIMNATATPMTLYSFKNSINSCTNPIIPQIYSDADV